MAVLLLVATPAWAAGPGGGGGGGGGGSTTGSLYSDLVIALRDASGAPILQKYVVPATTETDETTEYCVQPVSYSAVTGVTATSNPVDADRLAAPAPAPGHHGPARLSSRSAKPFAALAFLDAVAELERLNLARTSDAVIARKLADVKTKFTLGTTSGWTSRHHDGLALDATLEQGHPRPDAAPALPPGRAAGRSPRPRHASKGTTTGSSRR